MKYFIILIFVFSVLYSESISEPNLGNEFINAIKEDNIVSFSHCWVSIRQMEKEMFDLGIGLSEKENEKMISYMSKRNKNIIAFYNKINDLIEKDSIDRSELKLIECKLSSVRKDSTNYGILEKAGSVTVKFSDNRNNIFDSIIDDGIFDGRNWFFSDSPFHLSYNRHGQDIKPTDKPNVQREK